MLNSPIAMPPSPAAPAEHPKDFLAMLQKALLGTEGDSSQTDLLSSLLAVKMGAAQNDRQ